MATTTLTETSSDSLDPGRWTTSQELCLLQSLMHYKPVGIHKHFRMVNILDVMLASGTVPHPIVDSPHCSTTEGIWRKLESLYDLKALDEREDAIFADTVADDNEDSDKEEDEDGDEDESTNREGVVEYWREFELAGDDFEQQMWNRRLADTEEIWSEDGDGGNGRKRESTVGDSEDPRSSPVGSVRGTRSSGRRAAAGRRLAEVKQEDTPMAGGSAKGSRRTSKAASPDVQDEEDTEMHDADQDEEEGSGHDDDDSEQEETEDDNKKGKLSRAQVTRRGRSRRARRTK